MKKENKKENKEIIALIEDDDFLLKMYQTKLEVEGYKVEVAMDGEKGYSLIQKKKPQVVLLDIVLPKLNGFELLEKMKDESLIEKIPVILLTNLSHKEDIKKGLNLGAKDYLIKAHYMPSEVIEKIKQVLKKQYGHS